MEDPDYEKQPDNYALSAAIEALATILSEGDQDRLSVVRDDMWRLLANWWNTARWARLQIQASMEKVDLIGDLFTDIVHEIQEHFGDDGMREHYKSPVLKALILMDIGKPVQ
ncbi:unnamed protein product, partial [Rotaria sp. Silwood1]